MSTQTTNLGLVKPDLTDSADISVLNQNADKIDAAVPFKFGIDSYGRYGYIKAGANAITPFGGAGHGGLFPKENINTKFYSGQSMIRSGKIAPYDRYGFRCYRVDTNTLMPIPFYNYASWEIGMKIYSERATKSPNVLCGCDSSGYYQYSPSIELYSNGSLGIGHTHTAGTWTTWSQTPANFFRFGYENFIRLSFKNNTVTVRASVDGLSDNTHAFSETNFPSSSYLNYAFGAIAQNANYASDCYFDIDNMYILGDGHIIFGKYLDNNDETIV